jgi:hypothetical protein
MAQNKKNGFGDDIQGMPGYRTRITRSGLDPLDTSAESAYIEGRFLQRLFTFRVRARDFISLLLMLMLGVIPFPALAYLLISVPVEFFQNNPITFSLLGVTALFIFIVGIFTAVTGMLSINFILSLLELLKILPSSKTVRSVIKNKEKKKKHPKHRKDYK